MFPEKFITRIKDQLGTEADLFFEVLAGTGETSVRINPEKTMKVNKLPPVLWCEGGFYLDKRPVFTLDPRLHAGAYYVQEASSMFLQHAWRKIAVNLSAPLVLDLCASPGGKSTLLASEIGTSGFLVSNEVIRSRAQVLKENLIKWGHSHHLVTSNDPSDFTSLEAVFDVIVVDAPCSGEGLFRKDKNAIQEWSPEAVETCSLRQKRILTDVLPALKKDGYLIYSTCTYSPEENQHIINWLNTTGDWEGVDLQVPPEWQVSHSENCDLPAYHFYPHKTRGEGLFMCVLRKKTGKEKAAFPSRAKFLKEPDKKGLELVSGLLDGAWSHFIHNDEIRAYPGEYALQADYLCKVLKPVKLGIGLGEMAGKDLRPSHELALYSGLKPGTFLTYDCTLTEALKFLKKEDIQLRGQEHGWTILRFEGINLGFVKNLGNRCNNYYPKEWRILMELPKEPEALLW